MGSLFSVFSPPDSQFEPPTFLYNIIHHPLIIIFTFCHYILLYLRGKSYTSPKNSNPIRIVCISDTHTKFPRKSLPKGDVLIHAGDLTNLGTVSEIQQTIDWLKSLQKPWPGSSDGYMYIVVVCGNHDSYFDERSRSTHDKRYSKRKPEWGKVLYLQHSSITLEFLGNRKLNFYGAPQIPKCGGKEFAFQYPRGQDAWSNTIPDEVDVLITHNPPKWHLDIPENGGLGDEFELKEIWRVKPTLHVFGHVHAGHGKEYVWWDESQKLFEELREMAYGTTSHGMGSLPELLNVGLFAKGVILLWNDLKNVLWTRLWGGAKQGGIMVNAALTYRSTDKLGNEPQVVVL